MRHFLSALWATAKSVLGIFGEVVLVLGLVGHTVAPKRVTPWVCVAGLGLFSLAALIEHAKAVRERAEAQAEADHQKARAWHYEKEWSRALTDVHTRPSGEVAGQREFVFPDPHQLRLPPPHEGPYRLRDDDEGGAAP